MSTLDTLLKVAQARLDEVSREAARAADDMAALNRRVLALDERRTSELGRAALDANLYVAAGNFAGRLRDERRHLQALLEQQRAVVNEIRRRLTLAYQEKSKFEQLIERERVRGALARQSAEQKTLDEAAINLANRA